MHDPTDLERRISDLEIHITHQDSVMQDLNDMTTQQWATIDALKAKTEQLISRIREVEEIMKKTPEDCPPPHY